MCLSTQIQKTFLAPRNVVLCPYPDNIHTLLQPKRQLCAFFFHQRLVLPVLELHIHKVVVFFLKVATIVVICCVTLHKRLYISEPYYCLPLGLLRETESEN